MVARQRCAKRARLGNEQVARRQGAQDCETERDEHPERQGSWNSRSEATGAARNEQLVGSTRFSTEASRTRRCQSAQACLRREVPTDTRHTARRSGDSCGESQRLSFGGTAARRPKRNTELDRIHTQALSENGPEKDCDEEPEQPSSGNTDLHAQSQEEEESGVGQSSRPRTACEGAC